MLTRQWECTRIVIKDAVIPAGWYVAGSAIRPKLAVVCIILRVAGKTILGSAFKNIILMTRLAIQVCVIADERKRSGIMVKSRG